MAPSWHGNLSSTPVVQVGIDGLKLGHVPRKGKWHNRVRKKNNTVISSSFAATPGHFKAKRTRRKRSRGFYVGADGFIICWATPQDEQFLNKYPECSLRVWRSREAVISSLRPKKVQPRDADPSSYTQLHIQFKKKISAIEKQFSCELSKAGSLHFKDSKIFTLNIKLVNATRQGRRLRLPFQRCFHSCFCGDMQSYRFVLLPRR